MYENYKDEIKKIDFDDMLIRTYYLLKNNSETNDSNLIEAIENALKKYQYFNY